MEAVGLLERLGYTNLGHFGGGLVEWRKANLPFDEAHERSVRPEARDEGAGIHP